MKGYGNMIAFMKRKVTVKIFILAAVMLHLCLGHAGAQAQSGVVPGYFQDPAKPVEVTAGQEFVIVLDSNRTTGYQWQSTGEPDKGIVQLLGSEYHSSETELVGAGGKEIWKFKALKQGETVIALKYVRPWEKDVPPVKYIQFTVIVDR